MAMAGAMKKLEQLKAHFGERRRFTLLVMGQTGSGKTSFLNFLGNLDHLKQDDLSEAGLRSFVRKTIADESLEHAKDDAMASKTSGAKIYQVRVGPLHLTIIDTPGFGDSRGLEEDKKHVARIMDCLKEHKAINCVLLVINGREARLNPTLKYVFGQLTSIMPKSVVDNIAVVFSNTENQRSLNFEISELTNIGLKLPPFVCLDNPFCEVQRAVVTGEALDDDMLEELKPKIKKAGKSTTELLERIKDFPEVLTNDFARVNEVKSGIHDSLNVLMAKSDEARKYKLDVQTTQRAINEGRPGALDPVKRTYTKWGLTANDHHFYVCGAADCHKNCTHAAIGVLSSLYCLAFDSSTCHCGHSYKHHNISKNHWTSMEVEEFLVAPEVQSARDETQQKEIALRDLEQKLSVVESEEARFSAELREHIEEYSRLGLPDAYLRMLRSQWALIEERLEQTPHDRTMKEMLTTVKRQLDTIESRSDWACGVCMENAKNVEFSCGHGTCRECSATLGTCPICRAPITSQREGA